MLSDWFRIHMLSLKLSRPGGIFLDRLMVRTYSNSAQYVNYRFLPSILLQVVVQRSVYRALSKNQAHLLWFVRLTC